MKVRKVKIQAFRAYNKVEDGTFDFSSQRNREADFISLYAPNGFGKTSFYDAVEYAITNNVSRFIRSKLNENAAKSQKSASKDEKQLILRNTFATSDVETYVEVFTTNRIKPWKKDVKTPRKGNRDFKFSEEKTECKFFREVVLAQEWIDAFLLVDNAEERYNKFVNYFGDKKLDEYYRKIVDLLNMNEKQIELLKKNLKTIQKELDFKGDKEVLKKVNEKIKELIQAGESLDVITGSFNDADSLALINVITEGINSVNFQKKNVEEDISNLDSLVTESKQKKGLEAYFKCKVEIRRLDKKKDSLTELIQQFSIKQKLETELNNLTISLKQLQQLKVLLEKYSKQLPRYMSTKDTLNKMSVDLAAERKKKTQNEKKAKEISLTVGENKAVITQLQNQITSIQEELAAMPALTKKFKADSEKVRDIKQKIDEKTEALKVLKDRKKAIEAENADLRNAVKQIEKRKYPDSTVPLFSNYQVNVNDIKKYEQDLVEYGKRLQSVNGKIKQQEDLNKDIAAFISKGAQIADKNQVSICPLCTHDYGSFATLAKKIASNDILSSLMKQLLGERTLIETDISKLDTTVREKIDSLVRLWNTRIADNIQLVNALDKETAALNSQKTRLDKDLENISTNISIYEAGLKGLTQPQYQSKRKDELDKIKIDLGKIVKLLDSNTKELNGILTNLKSIENKIKVYIDTAQKTSRDKGFKDFQEYLDKNFPKSTDQTKSLRFKLASTTKDIDKVIAEIESTSTQLNKSAKHLKSYSISKLENELEVILKKVDLTKSAIDTFERTAATLLKKAINKLTKAELTALITNARLKSLKIKYTLETKIKDYKLLTELRTNVMPFLKYEKSKREESEMKERKIFLENKVGSFLETEKKKVSDYLDKQINSFFYGDLINDLYKRIDPHPDYKTIKFICDFTEDKPKLNVCLYQTFSFDHPIIPNLYFSTAQLNILSLSIFLAKALNAKNEKGEAVNCIFIDDPIQSMDSINILSTIDLLRSIVVTQGKQIILSTHDENFHNLLKKKMPPEFFNSKFMELETFGKVKQPSASEAY